MTQDELKKFDKKVRSVNDPFGTGFSYLIKILQDAAEQYGITEIELFQLHISWKKGHK